MTKTWIFILSLITSLAANAESLAEVGLKWQMKKEALSEKEGTLHKTKEELEFAFKEMALRQARMTSLINDLREKQNLSIPLSLVHTQNFDDTIHTLILLNRLKPRFIHERKKLLLKVKNYHATKKQFLKETATLADLDKEIKALESSIVEKCESRYQGNTKQELAITNAIADKSPKTLFDLAVLLQKTLSTNDREQNGIVKIQQPIRGSLKSITEDAEDTRVYVRIQAIDNDYVLSPWSGTVLYSGDFNDKKTIAVQRGDMILILQGNIDNYCKIGDVVELGEPVAKLSKTGSDVTFIIYKGDQVVDPLPFMTQKA